MSRTSITRGHLAVAGIILLALPVVLAVSLAGCGGGSGGPGPGGAGQGLVLVSFRQGGIDNLPLNEVLKFTFSEALDPSTVTPNSIQIRIGPIFGSTVPGEFKVDGTVATFEPALPGRCDFADAGFQPETDYRISVVGSPEVFCVRNSVGQALEATTTFLLSTRNVDIFRDGEPGVLPHITSVTPQDGSAEVAVKQGNQVVVEFNENIDPCTITPDTVQFHMVEVGDIDDGFIPVEDAASDPMTWGSTNLITKINPAQRIPSDILLEQDFVSTRLTISPRFGEFPENALLVLRLTSDILDFGGSPFAYETISFTTENRPVRTADRTLEYDATTPIVVAATTADVNSARAPSRAQGYLLFSGDGDNGSDIYSPSHPNSLSSGCGSPLQENDDQKDDFLASSDVELKTGDTANACPNSVDGSTAVVWEFKSFRIMSGATVRITGVNPAIILVQDEVIIESGGVLLARGDGKLGTARSDGAGGTATSTTGTAGGEAVAGGGDGGDGPAYPSPAGGRYGYYGVQGYFTDATGNPASEVGQAPGIGGGEGNTSGYWVTQSLCNRNLPSGGGGGHATKGGSGTALGTGASPVQLELAVRGGGGDIYGAENGRLLHPEAGSGGGAGGQLRSFAGTAAVGPGGAGGAGGGFVDLTCSGNIAIYGTIDAAGGRGGKGAGNPFSPNYTYNPGSGGGGGGSGGGIRIISAGQILLGTTTVLTAAGGKGGAGGTNQGTAAPVNNGGTGGMGRIVLEDIDSVISGLNGASVTPGDGTDGFSTGVFDPNRFAGGGLNTEALTEPMLAGPIPVPGISPVFVDPVASDFVAGIPLDAVRASGATGILVEARGWRMSAEGEVDESAVPSAWVTLGSLADSGTETEPAWKSAVVYGFPGDVDLPPDNAGTLVGMAHLTGYGYVQIRLTFYLPSTATPLTEGPYVDRMIIHFTYDQ